MPSALKTSEAAALGMHAAAILAAEHTRPLSCKEIASVLRVSAHHLSKVLQRMAKAGLVVAARGPKGGFTLGRPAKDITLLDVYQAIDGPLELSPCLFSSPTCDGTCILGDLLSSLNEQVEKALRGTRVSELAGYVRRIPPERGTAAVVATAPPAQESYHKRAEGVGRKR